jgi:hypothetical protein
MTHMFKETFNNVYIKCLDYNWTYEKIKKFKSHMNRKSFSHFFHSSLTIICEIYENNTCFQWLLILRKPFGIF